MRNNMNIGNVKVHPITSLTLIILRHSNIAVVNTSNTDVRVRENAFNKLKWKHMQIADCGTMMT